MGYEVDWYIIEDNKFRPLESTCFMDIQYCLNEGINKVYIVSDEITSDIVFWINRITKCYKIRFFNTTVIEYTLLKVADTKHKNYNINLVILNFIRVLWDNCDFDKERYKELLKVTRQNLKEDPLEYLCRIYKECSENVGRRGCDHNNVCNINPKKVEDLENMEWGIIDFLEK